MRLKKEMRLFIKEFASKLFPEADLFLFGSRLNNHETGGDIDILILSDTKIDRRLFREFRVNFYKEFGWQKIDMVNFTKNEDSTFKELILSTAKPL
jgi:uncharacterized protein